MPLSAAAVISVATSYHVLQWLAHELLQPSHQVPPRNTAAARYCWDDECRKQVLA
jgi:hypothetical protein